MNPLSAWTYVRRHWQRSALLCGLIGLVTLGLYLVITLVLITVLGPIQPEYTYLQKVSLVQPRTGNELDPAILAQIRAQPSVERVMPTTSLPIAINTLIGNDTFDLLAVRDADIASLLGYSGVTISAGRSIRPRSSEVMLSVELARNLGLQVGDQLGRTVNTSNFSFIREPLTLVGLLTGETRLGLISYEYVSSHELYRAQVRYGVLVKAKPGQAAVLDDFLVNTIGSPNTEVYTLRRFLAQRAATIRSLVAVFGPIALVITIVLTVVTAVIKQLELARRLAEFGTLAVIGYSKKWLIRRLLSETALLAVTGWLLGVLIPWLILTLLERSFFAPRGYPFHPFQPTAFLLTLPMPLAVIVVAAGSLLRTLARLDSIAVIERGELDGDRRARLPHRATIAPDNLGLPQPLAAVTYYQRHRRRGALLIGAMTLMIMAVVLLIFSVSATTDATMVVVGELKQMSSVAALNQSGLDVGLIAQLRTYPAVERVIPAVEILPLSITIPPYNNLGMSAYAIGAEDMAYLVERYGLQIKAGRLPRPRTNEVIIPETAALNRQLQVGDVLGLADAPAYPNAPVLPAPMVISGIFARAENRESENWLGFASLEFIRSHEGFAGASAPWLLTAKPGQKQALDRWLADSIASNQVSVLFYEKAMADFQANWRNLMTIIAIVEGVVVLVATLALAVLNMIFINGRQVEFGVLYALGFGRRWLTWRTVRETLFTTAIAWALSLLLCAIGLIIFQWRVYQPLGIALNFFNPTPWYFTLPVPVAVLLANTGVILRLLKKLDPVAIIEKA